MNESSTVNDDARKSTYYLIVGFLLSWLPMPICGLAVIPLAMSLLYGLRHGVALRRSGAPVVERRASMVGAGLTTLLIAFVLAPVVQYVQTLDYQRCMWGANTRRAVSSCEAQNHSSSGGILGFFAN